MRCLHCNNTVTDARVFSGVVGPFCNVDCRELWNAEPEEGDNALTADEIRNFNG